jgi:lipopolysaccharide biosynthesis glycosyltransferase
MGSPIAIISAGDEKYFGLLRGLIQSLHDQGWDKRADLYVLDVGLTAEQRAELATRVTRVTEGRWPEGYTPRPTTPRWFAAMLARPHLQEYFPGHEIYVWLDADTWLADSRALELLIGGAEEEGLALVPEVHAAYRWLYAPADWAPRANVRKCYAAGWGAAPTTAISAMPVLNTGVLGVRKGYSAWEKWTRRLAAAMGKTNHPLVEQCALNMAVYADQVKFCMLPAWCNWIWHQAQPRYNAERKRFEEPIRPYAPISISHGGDFKFSEMKFSSDVQCKLDYLSLKNAGLIAVNGVF